MIPPHFCYLIMFEDSRIQTLGPVGRLDTAPEWELFAKVGQADRIVELLKRLPPREPGGRKTDLKMKPPFRGRSAEL
ncbi:MAG: hypothetical protein A2Y79_03590 [Deltaproteobacteria bacterium RBG_13_43_22]|nr:MAG: hypothetical protein A2Y79_03590 [Deltaproteobacteria bacterium RBG_13_43_22]